MTRPVLYIVERIQPAGSWGEELRQEILDTFPALDFITYIGKFYNFFMFRDNVSSLSLCQYVYICIHTLGTFYYQSTCNKRHRTFVILELT